MFSVQVPCASSLGHWEAGLLFTETESLEVQLVYALLGEMSEIMSFPGSSVVENLPAMQKPQEMWV